MMEENAGASTYRGRFVNRPYEVVRGAVECLVDGAEGRRSWLPLWGSWQKSIDF